MSNTQAPEFFERGAIIAGRYEVVQSLGKGGMGTVLKVIDRNLDNHAVAIKLLYPHHVQDPIIFARFRNEVLITRELSHPNIVRIYDFGEAGAGYYFITMEYVNGGSLSGKIYRNKTSPLQFPEMIFILYQICLGIGHAHKKGIIHRDLKPDNVLLTDTNEVKITDFGLARTLHIDKGFTATGQTVGTPYYMSPEQIRGVKLDHRTDIYSLGIMAFEMATGRRPFMQESWFDLAKQHFVEPLPDFATEENGIPLWFQDLAQRCAAKEPEERYASADDVAAELEQYLFERAPTVHKVPAVLARHYASKRIKKKNAARRQQLIRTTGYAGAGLSVLFLALVLGTAISDSFRGQLGGLVLRSENSLSTSFPLLKKIFNADYVVSEESLVQSITAGNSAAVNVLLHAGLSPDTVDNSGTPILVLSLKASENSMDIMENIISHGGNLNQRDTLGKTVLIHAIEQNNLAAVQLLLSKGAQTNIGDTRAKTPLMYAAELDRQQILQAILIAKAAVNTRDDKGWTALMYASDKGNLQSVEALVEAKADASLRDNQGKTAEDFLPKRDRFAIQQLLQRSAARVNPNIDAGLSVPSSGDSSVGHTRLRQVGEAKLIVSRHSNFKHVNYRIEVTVSNIGSEQANNVIVQAILSDGRIDNLNGPQKVPAGQSAVYSVDGLSNFLFQIKETKLNCANCRK